MMNSCQYCGKPARVGCKFCRPACKQADYRKRKREQSRALSRFISNEFVELMGDEKAAEVFDKLEAIVFDKQINELNQALALITLEWRKQIKDLKAYA